LSSKTGGSQKGKSKKRKAASALEDDENEEIETYADLEDEESPYSSTLRKEKILHDLEMDCLALGGPDVGCGLASAENGRYSPHVRSAREDLIKAFLSKLSAAKKCASCSALPIAIRREGYAKLFRVDLTQKEEQDMASIGVRFDNALQVLFRQEQQVKAQVGEYSNFHEKIPSIYSEVDASPGLALETDSEGEEDPSVTAKARKKRGPKQPQRVRYMPHSEVAAHLQLLWQNEHETLRRVFLPVRSNGSLQRNASSAASLMPSLSFHASSGFLQSSRRFATSSAGPKDGWQWFFLTTIAVAPPRFRPSSKVGDLQAEHPQNVYLNRILRFSNSLVDIGLGKQRPGVVSIAEQAPLAVDLKASLQVWQELQQQVNGLLDSSKLSGLAAAKDPPNGIRQLLEKKEGMFRKNMMGKRVNYAARSVISPDPYLNTDQVGVPLKFAKTLTFKQAVTSWNASLLRSLVVNGADTWPGATHVEYEDGRVVDLSVKSKAEREGIARALLNRTGGASSTEFSSSSALDMPGGGQPIHLDVDPGAAMAAVAAGTLSGVGIKRVWRHMLDDDIVLMNRQPTLHKPSIMAHRYVSLSRSHSYYSFPSKLIKHSVLMSSIFHT
jgi:DNA-directed RNA polymerase I subunit RPA1